MVVQMREDPCSMRYNRDGRSPAVRDRSLEIRWLVSATWSEVRSSGLPTSRGRGL